MPIQIGGYHADGPHDNTGALPQRSGVYVILGRSSPTVVWNVVDIGESGNLQDRVANHDRAPAWRRQGHSLLSVAFILADERNRMIIEKQLRAQFNPPCGVI